jgi:hypothetical protein
VVCTRARLAVRSRLVEWVDYGASMRSGAGCFRAKPYLGWRGRAIVVTLVRALFYCVSLDFRAFMPRSFAIMGQSFGYWLPFFRP